MHLSVTIRSRQSWLTLILIVRIEELKTCRFSIIFRMEEAHRLKVILPTLPYALTPLTDLALAESTY